MSSKKEVVDVEEPWELYYWSCAESYPPKGCPGRGEYIRLIFVEAGVNWIEKSDDGDNVIIDFIYKNGNKNGYPVFACPLIKKGNFVLSQTPAISQYLGRKFNLDGESEEEKSIVLSIALCAADFLSEGRNSFHPVEPAGSYKLQVEEAKRMSKKFEDERLPKWLANFEKQLKYNNTGFFVGNRITYADLNVFEVLQAAESQFPEGFAKADIPTLRNFMKNIAARPRIKAYLESDKRRPYCGDSMQ